nr:hypothetical protein [Tanacetum cinerariifolium]
DGGGEGCGDGVTLVGMVVRCVIEMVMGGAWWQRVYDGGE